MARKTWGGKAATGGVIFSPYLGPTSRWAWVLSREVRAEPRIGGNRPGPGVVRVQQTPPLLLRLSQPWSSSDCRTNRLGALDPCGLHLCDYSQSTDSPDLKS